MEYYILPERLHPIDDVNLLPKDVRGNLPSFKCDINCLRDSLTDGYHEQLDYVSIWPYLQQNCFVLQFQLLITDMGWYYMLSLAYQSHMPLIK